MTARPRADLAYRVLDHIDAHPAQHNQATWFRQTDCGTVACFAGWAVVLAGHRIEVDPKPEPGTGYLYYDAIDGDRGTTIHDVAQQDLGILGAKIPCRCGNCGVMVDAAELLFDATNGRQGLGALVAEIFGPRPVTAVDEAAVDEAAWRECAHRADYLTPAEHANNCAYHRGEVDADGWPVDGVPRPHAAESSFAPSVTLKDSPDPMYPEGELDDVPPNAGSGS